MPSQQSQTNTIINDALLRDRAFSADELAYNRDLRNEAWGSGREAYNRAFGGYEGMQGGGLSAEDLARLRPDWMQRFMPTEGMYDTGGGGAGPSGYVDPEIFRRNWDLYKPIDERFRAAMQGQTVDVNRMRAGQPVMQEMMQTGGFSPEQLYSMGESLGALKGIGYTGGIDQNAMERMRGQGVFDEFAETGGYSDRDKALLRSRALSPIGSYYSGAQREMDRLGRVSGNLGPARAAMYGRLGRDQARTLSDVSRDAELEILDRVNQGRQWGGQNIASSEGALQGLRTGNMMNALTSSLNFERGLGSEIADRRLYSGQLLGQSEIPIQELLTDEARWGTTNLQSFINEQEADRARIMAEQNAARQAAAAAERSAWEGAQARSSAASRQRAQDEEDWRREVLGNEWDIVDFQNRARQFGTEGMTGLAGMRFDQFGNLNDTVQGIRAGDQSMLGTAGQLRIENNPHWSQVFGNVAGPIAGGIAGAVTGGWGGGGTSGGGTQTQSGGMWPPIDTRPPTAPPANPIQQTARSYNPTQQPMQLARSQTSNYQYTPYSQRRA